MRKLVYVIIGLFALVSLIKAYTSVRAGDPPNPPAAATASVSPILPSR